MNSNARLATFLFVGLVAIDARACVVCLDPAQSLLDKIEASDDVVAATMVDDDSNWTVEWTMRGSRVRSGDRLQVPLPIDQSGTDQLGDGHIGLFRWNQLGQFWQHIGQTDDEFLEFATRAVRYRYIDSAQSHQARVSYFRFFIPYLRHENESIAESATSKLASAPYSVLCDLGDPFTCEELMARIECSRVTSQQRALYIVLLGICGRQRELTSIDTWLADRFDRGSSEQLGALLAARGQMTGEETVELIEQKYLLRPDRSLEEIREAIAALRLHGEFDKRISRNRVAATYHQFVRQRPQLLELVVDDCLRWNDWRLLPELKAVYATGKQPWNHQLIETYLQTHSMRTATGKK